MDRRMIAVSCFLPFRLKSIVKWRGSVSFPIYQNRGMEEEAHKRVTMSYDMEWGSCFFDKNQYLEDVLGPNLNSTKLAESYKSIFEYCETFTSLNSFRRPKR